MNVKVKSLVSLDNLEKILSQDYEENFLRVISVCTFVFWLLSKRSGCLINKFKSVG